MMKTSEFCEYVTKYKNDLYVAAYAILKNEMDAEDAACSAILKGFENLNQLKNPHKFKPWMLTITKNEALKIMQKRLDLPGDEELERLLPPAYDTHHELWDIVQTLKDEYRLVIVLFYYSRLSIRDIANVLDIPVGTVKSRLSRGRELMKEALGDPAAKTQGIKSEEIEGS